MSKPVNIPVGAKYLAKDKNNNWLWLFKEPCADNDYVSVEEVGGQDDN